MTLIRRPYLDRNELRHMIRTGLSEFFTCHGRNLDDVGVRAQRLRRSLGDIDFDELTEDQARKLDFLASWAGHQKWFTGMGGANPGKIGPPITEPEEEVEVWTSGPTGMPDWPELVEDPPDQPERPPLPPLIAPTAYNPLWGPPPKPLPVVDRPEPTPASAKSSTE